MYFFRFVPCPPRIGRRQPESVPRAWCYLRRKCAIGGVCSRLGFCYVSLFKRDWRVIRHVFVFSSISVGCFYPDCIFVIARGAKCSATKSRREQSDTSLRKISASRITNWGHQSCACKAAVHWLAFSSQAHLRCAPIRARGLPTLEHRRHKSSPARVSRARCPAFSPISCTASSAVR